MHARPTIQLLTGACIALAGCTARKPKEPKRAVVPQEATYVGRSACADCHSAQMQAWQDSHHDRSMQLPRPSTVAGDFENARVTLNGVTWRFFTQKADARPDYFVETAGPEGAPTIYQIEYTLGVSPLQQYLARLPGGRLQALPIAWDDRPSPEGGKKWYPLPPNHSADPNDVLHWSGPSHNWNAMCARCHSTGVRKRFQRESNSYTTTFSDVDVSCESCHGPGSNHVKLAHHKELSSSAALGLTVRLDERAGVAWNWDPASRVPKRSKPRAAQKEIDVCGSCHARRGELGEGYTPGDELLDHFRVDLLMPGLYHPDGQIDDEVYVYGSFLQSKMHRAGVTCSDCHDPHSQRLRASGNALCSQCHPPKVYDTPAHHHHAKTGPSQACVSCHMPSKTYMGIDQRRDHSFRIPRPTSTAPNACNGCHRDKSTPWVSAALARWYGAPPKRASNFAEAFSAAKGSTLDAEQRLLGVIEDEAQPAIVRGTALALLPGLASSRAVEPTRKATASTEPLVRYGAARALCGSPPPIATELGAPLLTDPVRLVRLTAAECLAKHAGRLAAGSQFAALGQALQEYQDVMRFNADQAQSLVNLANLASGKGDVPLAKSLLKEALEREPGFVPASVNLADVVRKGGNEIRAREILQAGLARNPTHPDLHLALGLSLARSGAQADALKALQLAYEHSDGRADTGYVLGMALDAMGQPRRALEVLSETQRRHPAERSVLLALVSLCTKQGRKDAARRYAQKLTQAAPETAQRARELLGEP